MSVSLGQMHKAGLSAPGLKRKTKGTSAQAAKNLANSSAATKSTKFSFNKTQQWNYVAGQNTNKSLYKYDFTGLRARAKYEVPKSRLGPSYSMGSNLELPKINADNSVMKGMIWGSIANGTFGLLNSIIGSNSNNVSSTAKQNSTVNTDYSTNLGNVSGSSTAGVISTMSSAENSSDLRAAISSADSELTSLNSQSATLKEAKDTAQANLKTLEPKVSDADKGVKDAEQQNKKANNKVDIKTKARDSKKIGLENAQNAYNRATSNYETKKTAHETAKNTLSQAKATLDATPEYKTITNPDGSTKQVKNDPAYTQAKQAYDAAVKAEAIAAEEEKAAKQIMDQNKQAVDKAKTELENAKTELETAEKELNKAKEEQKTAEQQLKQAQEAKDKAQQELDSANSAIDKYNENQQDIKELTSAITKQKERLTKLEKQEQEQYASLTRKIADGVAKNDARDAKINTSDGMNLKETYLKGRMDKTNAKNEKRLEQASSLESHINDTQWIHDILLSDKTPPDATIDQVQYKKGTTPSGQEVYYRGQEPISKEAYEEALKSA